MIGIYKEEFIERLKDVFGEENVKITSSNIICPCPYCEYPQKRSHYHLYISLEVPIFNCFRKDCKDGHGFIGKFIKKVFSLNKKEIGKFVDEDKLKYIHTDKILTKKEYDKNYIIDDDKDRFPYKKIYLKKRLGFIKNDFNDIKGLIFDFKHFLRRNNISFPKGNKRNHMINFLQDKFIGFLTEHKTMIVCRNIDSFDDFRYYKLFIGNKKTNSFPDYYKIDGNLNGTGILIGEGIFDIYAQKYFDFIKTDKKIFGYYSALSQNFYGIINSILLYEYVGKFDLIVLSDSNIPIEYYKKFKKERSYLLNSMDVYYNTSGGDFAEMPVIVNKFKI